MKDMNPILKSVLMGVAAFVVALLFMFVKALVTGTEFVPAWAIACGAGVAGALVTYTYSTKYGE